MYILFIALLHGFPIFLAGVLTGSRGVVRVVAIVMAVIAVATGGFAHAGIDLLVVFATYWWLSSSMGAAKHQSAAPYVPPATSEKHVEKVEANPFGVWLISCLILAGIWGYSKYKPSEHVPVSAKNAPQNATLSVPKPPDTVRPRALRAKDPSTITDPLELQRLYDSTVRSAVRRHPELNHQSSLYNVKLEQDVLARQKEYEGDGDDAVTAYRHALQDVEWPRQAR